MNTEYETIIEDLSLSNKRLRAANLKMRLALMGLIEESGHIAHPKGECTAACVAVFEALVSMPHAVRAAPCDGGVHCQGILGCICK